jgi:hypothetical protein
LNPVSAGRFKRGPTIEAPENGIFLCEVNLCATLGTGDSDFHERDLRY